MKINVWIVSTCIPEPGEGPCFPNVFATEAEAEAYADEMMRAEWESHGPYDDDSGEKIEYPGDWREAQDAIVEHISDGSWGTWEITQHEMEAPETAHPAAAFIERMANFTTPEDEFADPDFSHKGEYETVDEYVSDMSDCRLCDEYGLFMAMVREAREIRDAQPAPVPSRIVVEVTGEFEVIDAEGWPEGLDLYLVTRGIEAGDPDLCHVEGPCRINKYGADTPQADGMTGHFAKNVAEAWQHD